MLELNGDVRGRRSGIGALAAALFALLMLSCASVQSNVMQMAMAAATGQPMGGSGVADPAMAAMVGMAARPQTASSGLRSKGHAPAKACPYCAAAAHPPLVGTAPPWRTPSAFTFAAFRVVASHGPGGPPAPQPRARGPPPPPLTL